jgi:hypothetical protein
MNWRSRVGVLSAALWWGSLTAIGFIAVPLLFANAASPATAGALAAKLFEAQSWLGLVCGVLLLMGARHADGRATMDWAGGAIAYVLLGMLCALLQEFAIAPRIAARQDLRFWHGAGTAVYAAQWLCALVVLWRTSGSLSPRASS